MTDFELARPHYVYAFDTTSTVTVTNDIDGIKLKPLGGVAIKRVQVLKGHIRNIICNAALS